MKHRMIDNCSVQLVRVMKPHQPSPDEARFFISTLIVAYLFEHIYFKLHNISWFASATFASDTT